MSLAKAHNLLIKRLGAGNTVLLAILLDLPRMPDWCDGTDAGGRSVCVVGRHNLGTSEAPQEVIAAVLDAMKAGEPRTACWPWPMRRRRAGSLPKWWEAPRVKS